MITDTKRTDDSIQRMARTAGFLYLLFFITFIFSSAGVEDRLIKYGDAAATIQNILANEWLFRMGFVSNLLSAAFFVLAAWALYGLLKPVNHDLALLVVLLNACGVGVQCLSLLFEFAVLLLTGGADYLRVFSAGQLQVLAMLSLYLYRNGFMIAQLFFSAWLLPLGYLVFKSGFLPKLLGVLLMADFLAVLMWFLQFFLFPGFEAISYPGMAVSFIAEIGITLWLLIKGVDVERWKKVALGSTAE
jgi:hypothetical protein